MNETRGYLYILKDDHTFTVREGSVSPVLHNWQRTVRFTPDKGKGSWCYVSSSPCEIYYRKIWMTGRDDELATRLFIEYHERKIKECEKNLEMHKQCIAVLKGENYESINLG